MNYSTCENKKTFPTSRSAKDRAKEINEENGNDKMRAYQCNWCGYWHLSSMSKGEFDKRHGKAKQRQKKRINIESEFWEGRLK